MSFVVGVFDPLKNNFYSIYSEKKIADYIRARDPKFAFSKKDLKYPEYLHRYLSFFLKILGNATISVKGSVVGTIN